MGTDNSERFEEYYNTASNLLSDLKDLEEEQEEEKRQESEEEIGEEAEEEEMEDKVWFEEEGTGDEKETDRKNGGAEL